MNPGQTFYLYTDFFELSTYTFIEQQGPNYILFWDNGDNIVKMNKAQFALLKTNEDEAQMVKYINDRDLLVNQINKLNEQLQKKKDNLRKLNNRFGDIIKKFPEKVI